MERLFSRCTRFLDLLEDGWDDFGSFRELSLVVSTEELLSDRWEFTYTDFYAMLENYDTIAWLTPQAGVICLSPFNSYTPRDDYRFQLSVNGYPIVALARSSAALSEIFDVLRRLLLADVSAVYDLKLCSVGQSREAFFNAPRFASLVEQCQNLEVLKLEQIVLDEDHIRVLGDFSKPGLEIELSQCRIVGAAATELVQILRRNQGLECCEIDNFVLADGLRGNTSLKGLTPRISGSPEIDSREVLAFADALRENKGIVGLDLRYNISVRYEAWNVVCNSLMTHPTLQTLDLHASFPHATMPAAVLKSQIQALADMLKENVTLQRIFLHSRYSEHELFRGTVEPYLKSNRFRPRVCAIQKTRPMALRANVLGQALLSVRTDSNRFWMLLSQNADVVFPSTTAIATPAATLILPTPPTVAPPVHVDPVVASDSTTAAASNTLVSTTCLKRKACP
jgi:hypothetical protein